MKRLIGIEREYFLVDEDGNIVEPALYGFQIDEFGFLIEIRTEPHDNPQDLLNEFGKLLRANYEHAKSLGFTILTQNRAFLPYGFKAHLKEKYHWDSLPDLTANINYGTSGSHATGIDGDYGTAGTHVHFSKHNDDGDRVQLPIRDIVVEMDRKFAEAIHLTERIPGEYEIKPHGFEYRSLSNNLDITLIVEHAFQVLEEIG